MTTRWLAVAIGGCARPHDHLKVNDLLHKAVETDNPTMLPVARSIE